MKWWNCGLFAASLSLSDASSVFAFVPCATTKVTTSTAPKGKASWCYNRHSRGALVRLASNGEGNPFQSLLGGLLQKQVQPAEPEKPEIPDVVIDPSYSLAVGFAIYGLIFLILLQGSIFGVVFGGLNVLFASFLAIQTYRLRFFFDETSFELKEVDAGSLVESGENIVVGGQNRWTYDSFVSWDFFPNVNTPILVYFKETQTPQDKWKEGPGQLDKVGGGQIHFFPAISNCKQIEEQFIIRGCAKVE